MDAIASFSFMGEFTDHCDLYALDFGPFSPE
jgi:hypothetical protein